MDTRSTWMLASAFAILLFTVGFLGYQIERGIEDNKKATCAAFDLQWTVTEVQLDAWLEDGTISQEFYQVVLQELNEEYDRFCGDADLDDDPNTPL